ncbi:MAG: hypothetical protein ACE5NM_08380, partial [Sedimentisphaerales bacterium]
MIQQEMVNCKSTFNLIVKLTVILIFAFAFVAYAKSDRWKRDIQPTRGQYMGHKWHIDGNHLLWWDGEPYVRYGFTGNGQVDKFMKLGFDQFNVSPSEELWVFSKDPQDNKKAIKEIDEFTDKLVQKGATYYAGLNSLWPWQGSGKVAQQDMVEYMFKKVWDITEFSGANKSLKLSFIMERNIDFDTKKIKIYLFDMTEEKYDDISDKLKNIKVTKEQIRESPSEVYTATRYTLVFEKFQLPESKDLRVTMLSDVFAEMVPNVYPSAFPALWKPSIIEYYKKGLESFKKPYAKEGLRGLMFGDEINTHKTSLFYSQTYVNFNDDEVALKAYRSWLKGKFRTISELNKYLQTDFTDFSQVGWHICIYPFLEKDLNDDEGSSSAVKKTFGLFESAEQLKKIDKLQEEFRIWFYGYWLTRYARMAKEIIGNVPVFLTSAGIGGNAEDYLQIHKQAMLQGIDGLVRNHYAHVKRTESGWIASFEVWSDRRFPLETVTSLLNSVQKESGKTKTYFANEFGWPKKGGFDDFGLGDQFSFPSKKDLRSFLHVLIDNGYKGFNMFKMNPNVKAAQKEVEWLAELKQEIVQRTIQTIEYNREIKITKEQAIYLARQNPKLKRLFKKHPNARASAFFSERYDAWIVEFLANDREIGFASVSKDGSVLEV